MTVREKEAKDGEGRIWKWRKDFEQKSPFFLRQQGLDLGWDTQVATPFPVSVPPLLLYPPCPALKFGKGEPAARPGVSSVLCQGSSDLCAAHMLLARHEIHPSSVLGWRMWISQAQRGLIEQDLECFYKGADASETGRFRRNKRGNKVWQRWQPKEEMGLSQGANMERTLVSFVPSTLSEEMFCTKYLSNQVRTSLLLSFK